MNHTSSSFARTALLCLLSCTWLAACGASFQAHKPSGFVELTPEQAAPYDFRATSPDGVVMAVRELPHEPQGELSFWAKAIENELRDRGGYALLHKEDVKTKQGVAGRHFRFGHDEGSQPHLYWITVFVTPSKIYLFEAGGTQEQMEQSAQALQSSMLDLRLK